MVFRMFGVLAYLDDAFPVALQYCAYFILTLVSDVETCRMRR